MYPYINIALVLDGEYDGRIGVPFEGTGLKTRIRVQARMHFPKKGGFGARSVTTGPGVVVCVS